MSSSLLGFGYPHIPRPCLPIGPRRSAAEHPQSAMGYRDDAYGAEQGTPLNGGGMARRRQQHHTPYRDDSNFHGRSPYGPASPQGSLGAVPAAGYGHSSDAGSLGAKEAKGHRVVASVTACLRRCGCSSHAMRSDEGPDGRYYRDDFNDQSWACAFGTGEEHGIWMNQADEAGTVMALMVWVLMGELKLPLFGRIICILQACLTQAPVAAFACCLCLVPVCESVQDPAEGMFQVGQDPGASSGDEPAAKRARQ